MKKTHLGVKIGVRVKIKLKIVFKIINFIFPENLDLLDLFLSRIWYNKKIASCPTGVFVCDKFIMFLMLLINMD